MDLDDVVTQEVPRSSPDGEPGDGGGGDGIGAWFVDHSAQLALGAFVAYLVVAFFLLLLHFGEGSWFQGDDWGFIEGRSMWSFDDLMRPQNGHWSAVPVIAFQALYKVVGLRSYLPYMGTTIVLHLTLATLLRVVMRRAGAGPWVATIVAGTYVLFGVGYENILLGIQISMVASMVFGIAQLLLSDHDGPFDRRDAIGLACGLVAIMASSIGIPMVVAVGVAVLIRRGWRLALATTAPLAAIYVAWMVWQRSVGGFGEVDQFGTRNVGALVEWVISATTGVFVSLGQYPAVAVALAALLIGGCALAWVPLDRDSFRRLANAPIALLVGGIALSALVGTQRADLAQAFGLDLARSSRYMAMATVMTLPALAVAAAAVIRRWRVAAPAVLALFVIGVPANIAAFDTSGTLFNRAAFDAQRTFVIAVADSDLARDVAGDVHPDPNELTTANLTVDFLVFARKSGKLPDPVEVDQALEDRIAVRLSMSQSILNTPEPAATCTTQTAPLEIEPDKGQQFVLRSPVNIALRDGERFTAPSQYATAWAGSTLTTQVDDATFRITPVAPATTFEWCPAT